MLDHNDTGVMSSLRVVHAKGLGVSDGSVRSNSTDSMGMRALSPLWPYPKVSQDILSLSNGGLGQEGELVTLPSAGNYTVESLIAPCGKESSSSVMSVSRELHSAQG